MKENRIAVFVDSANMHHACKRIGYFIDWKRVIEYFNQKSDNVCGYFYYAIPPSTDLDRMKFLDFLSYNGYVVRTKQTKTMRDSESGDEYRKANLVVDIALDMLSTSDHWDTAYLFSGDGDFERVLQILRNRGKQVYIVTTEKMLARELAYAADKPVIWLEDIEDSIARTDRRPEDDITEKPVVEASHQ